MSQADFTLDGTPVTGTSGTAMATLLNAWKGAVHTNHSGASRPSYATAGMTWVKTVSGTAHELYYYDGTDDILLGTFNPTANTFSLPMTYDIFSNSNNAELSPTLTPPDGMSWSKGNNRLTLSNTSAVSLRMVRHGSNGLVQEFYRNNTSVGSISITTTATTYSTSSDYRLKENVESILTFDMPELDGPLGKLMRVRPVKYDWITDPSAGRQYGFIAHELQAEVPHAVTGFKDEMREDDVAIGFTIDANTGEQILVTERKQVPVMQGVDHSQVMSLAVAAIQQLTLRVLELERKLANETD